MHKKALAIFQTAIASAGDKVKLTLRPSNLFLRIDKNVHLNNQVKTAAFCEHVHFVCR